MTSTRTLPLRPGAGRPALLTVAALVVVAFVLAWAPGRAAADSPVFSFSVTPSNTQAGGHPNLVTKLWVGNRYNQQYAQPSCDCQDPRDVNVEMPTGVIGIPSAAPTCSAADFANQECPPETQVGAAFITINAEPPGTSGFGRIAIFNLEPHPGEAGLLAFNFPLLHFPVYQAINSRTESDYGLDITTEYITHLLPLAVIEETIWGVPASPANSAERMPTGWDSFEDGLNPPTPSNAQERAFINNPTACDQPNLSARVEVFSYDKGVTEGMSPFPATTGCDQLSFNPSLYAQPTTTATDSASGLDVDLQVPQQTSPVVPSPSEIRATTVSLPPGFSINPNAADGKTSCDDETQALIGTRLEAQCPEDSKVGTVSVDSSALPGPIPGYVYLGKPLPGNRYRLILTANGYNVHVKVAGSVLADEKTGQITVSFQNLPQTPFTDFNLHFFGSERGLLATPEQCGTYGVSSTFTPWDSELSEQTSTQYFSLTSGPGGSPCPPATRPFNPTFQAGVTDKTGGRHSSFSLVLGRNDGDQTLSALDVSTPPGFSATLAGVTYCADSTLAGLGAPSASGLAELASPACPSSSQIGTATAAAGAGDHPVYLPGKVYLAGPYKGAPLSLAVVTPAVSGPYDLGNVVVRAALHVDPVSAQITAESDPLPQILDGIPLRLRQVMINLERKNFTLNPTNCDPFAVGAKIFGNQGATSTPQSPFQVADCAGLAFGPKLNLKLAGGTTRAKNPALTATLTAKPGEANISQAIVTMPHSIFLDQSHVGSPCTKVQFAANNCPAKSVLGTAVAVSPLLEKPLEGTVYLASGYGHKLPDVLAALKGQVNINLDGIVSSFHQGLRTSFKTVPDVPVTKFTLKLLGGKKGLLVNSANLCKAPQLATVNMVGQNNRRANTKPRIQVPCGKKKSAKGKGTK
jgi:hypothetical protein